MEKRRRRDGAQKLFYLLGALWLLFWAARELLPAVLPLLLGGALAALLHPAAAGLSAKLGCRYRPAAVFTAIFTALVLGLLLWGLGGLLFEQGSSLLEKLPQFLRETVPPFLSRAETWLESRQGLLPGRAEHTPGEFLQEGLALLSGKLIAAAGALLSSLPGAVLTLSFTVLAAFLILLDYKRVTSFLVRILPGRTVRRLVETKRFLLGSARRVTGAYFLILLITFFELSLGLWLLRVPYFAVIGFVIALFDILPFIGSGLFLIPWGLAELFLVKNTRLGMGLLLLYAVVAAVRFFLEPHIVGGRIGLSPPAVLAAMAVGGALFGLGGVVLGPLLVTLLLHLDRKGLLREKKQEPLP